MTSGFRTSLTYGSRFVDRKGQAIHSTVSPHQLDIWLCDEADLRQPPAAPNLTTYEHVVEP